MKMRIFAAFLLFCFAAALISSCSKKNPTQAPAVQIPSAPVLATPTDGDTCVSIAGCLLWNMVSDASSYIVQVARDSLFDTVIVTSGALTQTAYQPNNLVLNTEYFWHAKAVNQAGESPWSARWRFRTAHTDTGLLMPATPVLSAPSNGDTSFPAVGYLVWNVVPEASAYVVQVARDSLFDTLAASSGLIIQSLPA